jgi:hypothetical protein
MVIGKMLKTIVLLIFLVIFFSSCVYNQDEIPVQPPERQCNAKIDWRGLIPGQSNMKDVIRILGNPSKKGKTKFEDRNISYYAYEVDGGVVADYVMDRIFFRTDGVIDWMEIIQADRTTKVETVFDLVLDLGNELDVVYSSNNFRPGESFYEVLSGLNQIYVWSECGLALDALPTNSASAFGTIETGCKIGNESPQMCDLTFRHLYPPSSADYSRYDINSIVLMKFYFQPTSYQGFTDYYMYKIPFRTWGEYLHELGK